MKIALDAHGGDLGLKPNVEGAVLAAAQLDHEIILVGRDPEIREELRRLGAIQNAKIRVVHAPQLVEMAKEPVEECRSKPNSSLMVGIDLVRDGASDAFISAGNSGAVMVAALLKLKRIGGIIRPALAAPYPTPKGITLLIDAGANTDSKPWHLAQFAIMGSIYMRARFAVENPKVGIMSVGEEETKGGFLVTESIPLLKNMDINFYGPVEGRDLPEGVTDVVVTDGFTGNVALKLSEGLAKVIFKMLKDRIMGKFTYKIGAMLMKKVFTDLRKKMNPDEYGGAPLLGVNGVVLICHGKSTPKAISSAIAAAGDLARSGLVEQIKKHMAKVSGRITEAKTAHVNVKGLKEWK
ncbi:MAG: phosphate acyltransferase PlsX [Elusimicrobia bacterium]|nr:phosphate acyltransferase PlsX [Elusimicrobiota bacterium]